MTGTLGRCFALAGCIIGAVTLLTQFAQTMSLSLAAGRGVWGSLVFFFSFFTILSNILAVLCLAASAYSGASRPLAFFRSPGVQTAVALYMLVVAVIYIGV
ncbi:MAG: Pr6Pr family membrane protein, partial [Parvibaculaceae bacterium]